MSKNVCSIYKYTVGMLYAAGRGQKGDVVKKKCIRTESCLCEPNYQSSEKDKKKKGGLKCA
jgi:hypothetical protein